MTSKLLALLAPLGLAACGNTFPQDLERFCAVVGEVDKIEGISAEEKLSRIDARRGEYARYGLLETRDVWAEASSQHGQDRYRYLLAAGRNLGAREWRCPAYATLLNIAEVQKLGVAAPVPPPPPVAPVAETLAATTQPAARADVAKAEPVKKKGKAGKKARVRKKRG